jgi:pimeloyl-ACP methyl ester carboxylesterase
MVTDRAVILYDHLGCGQSSRMYQTSSNGSATSSTASAVPVSKGDEDGYLNGAVQDLAVLIQTVLPDSSSFHLLGHSLGGVVAYEYLKLASIGSAMSSSTSPHVGSTDTSCTRRCRSIVLASTPVSIAASHTSSKRLLDEIRQEMRRSGKHSSTARASTTNEGDGGVDSHDDLDETDDEEESSLGLMGLGQQPGSVRARIEFQRRHECRVSPMPLPLQQSLEGLSPPLQTSLQKRMLVQQVQELRSYVAEPWTIPNERTTINTGTSHLPLAALILRGQYDFVDEPNMRGWTELLTASGDRTGTTADDSSNSSPEGKAQAPVDSRLASSCQFITLANCSHYSLVENEDLFGSVLMSFLRDHDAD